MPEKPPETTEILPEITEIPPEITETPGDQRLTEIGTEETEG